MHPFAFIIPLLLFIGMIGKELNVLFNKKFVLLILTLLIPSLFITYKHHELRDGHFNATLTNYNLTINNIRKIDNHSITDKPQLLDFSHEIEEISNNIDLLLKLIEHSSMLSWRDRKQLYSDLTFLLN